jgi:hypothetical protein
LPRRQGIRCRIAVGSSRLASCAKCCYVSSFFGYKLLSERLNNENITSSLMDPSSTSESSIPPHDTVPGPSQYTRQNDLASQSLAGFFGSIQESEVNEGLSSGSHAPHPYTYPHGKPLWLWCQSVLVLTCNGCNGRIRTPLYPRLRAEHPPPSGAVVSSTCISSRRRCAFFIYDSPSRNVSGLRSNCTLPQSPCLRWFCKTYHTLMIESQAHLLKRTFI